MTEWTPRLLLISACNLVRLLFESGVYSRAASISFRAGTEIQVIINIDIIIQAQG